VRGQTWYSIFSPRTEKQSIAIEPNAAFASGTTPSVNTWFGLPSRAQFTLLAHPYHYGPHASTLEQVPLQVWSTKGFEAQWLSHTNSSTPLVESTLRQSPSGEGVIGTVSHNLPTQLENAALIVSRIEPVVIPLGTLAPGTPKSVTAQDPRPFTGWVTNPLSNAEGWLPANILFHERANPQGRSINGGLRRLDLSWRIENDRVDHAILVGTMPRIEGTLQEVFDNPASPSRLQMNAEHGFLRQDTCFRAILPVRPSNFPRR
jgi:hypothetical protein